MESHLALLAQKTLKIETPTFTLYNDKEMEGFSDGSQMGRDVRCKLIRCSVDNMITVCHNLQIPRWPNINELKEMAIKLVNLYPGIVSDKMIIRKTRCVNDNNFVNKHLQVVTSQYNVVESLLTL